MDGVSTLRHLKTTVIVTLATACGSAHAAVNYWDFNVFSGSTIGSAGQGYGSQFAGASGAVGDAWFSNMGLRTSASASPSLPMGFYGGGNFVLSGGVHSGGVVAAGDVLMNNASVVGPVLAGGNLAGAGGSITGDAILGGTKITGNQLSVSGSILSNQTITEPVALGAAAGYFSAFSTAASALSPTTSYTNQWGNLVINASAPGAVVSIAAADFQSAWGISVAGPGAVIVNVDGTSLQFASKTWAYSGGASATSTLLNFAEANSITMTGSQTVNMLAPGADVRFTSGTITGNLVVGSLTGSGSTAWNGGFDGASFVSVPAPAGASLIAIAGCVVGARRRRPQR